MKRIAVISMTFAGAIFFSSCQQGKDVKRILSKSDTRMEVMNTIANSDEMSNEMKEVMFKKENTCINIKENFDEIQMMTPATKTEKYKSDQDVNCNTNFTLMVN